MHRRIVAQGVGVRLGSKARVECVAPAARCFDIAGERYSH